MAVLNEDFTAPTLGALRRGLAIALLWRRPSGSGTVEPGATTTMLSRPTGFGTLGFEGFESVTCSVSILSVSWGFDTVAKLPNVFGTVPDTVNTVFPFSRPVKVKGMGVVLE